MCNFYQRKSRRQLSKNKGQLKIKGFHEYAVGINDYRHKNW